MVGVCKPSKRSNLKTFAIGADINVIFNHYLEQKGYANVSPIKAGGVTDYHLEGEYLSITEASETPIYNQILEIEMINLYELCEEVRSFDGTVLDVNTDCVVCTFPDNKLPFEVDEDQRVKGYYHDKEKAVPI